MKEKSVIRIEVLLLLSLISLAVLVYAEPTGPSVDYLSNSTKASGNGTVINGTPGPEQNPDEPNKAGGYIYSANLVGETQNVRWKAYVGNVSGSLVLDDADGYSIFDWTINSTVTGEVYATRLIQPINWTNINCSYYNATQWEEADLNHSNENDNITSTFDGLDNDQFFVGSVRIDANTCPTTNIYVNDTAGLSDDFEQVILYDGDEGINLSADNSSVAGFKNIIYAAVLEQDAYSYRGNDGSNQTFDFQMILPEDGTEGWASTTGYYFYVELS